MAMSTKCIKGKNSHKLEKKNYNTLYTCYGCGELGFGVRHRCDQCSYEFHEACTLINPILRDLIPGLDFRFMPTPPIVPGHTLCCNACGNVVKGFVFYCEIPNQTRPSAIALHPCCTKLKNRLEFGNLRFSLMNKVEGKCIWCQKIRSSGGKINGWSYRSECKKYHVHVSCVTQIALARENKNLYVQNSITNLRPTTSRRQNNDSRIDMAKEAFMFIAESILSTFIGDPTTLIASSILHFLLN